MKNNYNKNRAVTFCDRFVRNSKHSFLHSLSLMILLFGWNVADAQPSYNYANGLSIGFSLSTDVITADDVGNVYLTGFFSGTVDFDPSPGTTSLTSVGDEDIFIAKYDTEGALLWAKAIAGQTAGNKGEGWAITLDDNNNIYLAGRYAGTFDFDPSTSSSVNLSSVLGLNDIFMAKYDNNGNYKWAHSIGGSWVDEAHTIVIDPAGDLYISGIFGSSTVDFDPSSSTANLTKPLMSTQDHMFIAKYDTAGNYIWAKNIGGGGDGAIDPRSMAFDNSNNLILSGFFKDLGDFDPAISTTNYLYAYDSKIDIFLAKYDSNGNFIWAGNPSGKFFEDRTHSVAIDDNDNIYICGELRDTVDFDFSATTSNLIASAGTSDIFLVKYDASGNLVWAKSMQGPTGNQGASGLSIDQHQHLVMTGWFDAKIDLDPSPAPGDTAYLSTQSFVAIDSYIASYDTDGNYLWASRLGGSGLMSVVISNTVFLDENNNVYASGVYGPGKIDFDPDTAVADTAYLETSAFFGPSFLAKYRLCFNDTTQATATICDGDAYSFGSQSLTSAGTYTEIFSSTTCGDSVVSLKLSVTTADISVTQTGNHLSANATGVTYQWTDCAAGPISGETSKDFMPTKNGEYAVVITKEGCSFTSACYKVVLTGINHNTSAVTAMQLYPNPTDGMVSVKLNSSAHLLISNSIGKVVYSTTLPAGVNELDLHHLPAGIYVVSNAQQHFKLIVE